MSSLIEPIQVADMQPGLRVVLRLHGTEVPDEDVTSPDGVIHQVVEGHAGIVRDCTENSHVLVDWDDLDGTELSESMGFGFDESGEYPGLGRELR